MGAWMFDGVRHEKWNPGADLRSGTPTPARMYDYFLGGRENYAVDREAAERVILAVGPAIAYDAVWENRRFLQRAVRWLAEHGIDQFIDIGAGLPTQGNVHQIAQKVIPDARVAYVDNDPVVLAHGRALLADNSTTRVITADMRDPTAILTHPDLTAMIDLTRPVAVLFIAVLHFLPDGDGPARVTAAFRQAMAPGSYVALSHNTGDGQNAEVIAYIEQVYRSATSPMVFRSQGEIARLLDGFDLIPPGLVRPAEWHPTKETPPSTRWQFAGIATKLAGPLGHHDNKTRKDVAPQRLGGDLRRKRRPVAAETAPATHTVP
jgi:SAM-dependent methyltransferase